MAGEVGQGHQGTRGHRARLGPDGDPVEMCVPTITHGTQTGLHIGTSNVLGKAQDGWAGSEARPGLGSGPKRVCVGLNRLNSGPVSSRCAGSAGPWLFAKDTFGLALRVDMTSTASRRHGAQRRPGCGLAMLYELQRAHHQVRGAVAPGRLELELYLADSVELYPLWQVGVHSIRVGFIP